MNYLSTRGSIKEAQSAEAIRTGIAPDGGLFTPESIPNLSQTDIQAMAGLNYQELAAKILAMYLTDYKIGDLQAMTTAAYAYPAKFSVPQVTPVVQLAEKDYMLELFHGPTCAFKDVALQLLPYLMTKAGEISGDRQEIIILVATSGDTGKAALEGFRDVPGTRIIVFFPEEGVSRIQKLQMTTQEGANTRVVGVKGNFDDAQNGVKAIFTDAAIVKELAVNGMSFSSANSINWGRLAPQIVYYFYGYLDLCRRGTVKPGSPINIAVPTGNFGNILAGYFAKEMGLPIARMICASNSNNVLTDFINTGVYDRNRTFYTTISPSMDILISSNLERLLFYLANQDPKRVGEWMMELRTKGGYRVDRETELKMKSIFYGGFANEDETKDTIGRVYRENNYVMDPHTAVGKTISDRYRRETGDDLPTLLVATASPFKFNRSVVQAVLGETAVQDRSEFELLEKLKEISEREIPAGLRGLDRKEIRHRTVCSREEMPKVVKEILQL
jgi:threonine synthase